MKLIKIIFIENYKFKNRLLTLCKMIRDFLADSKLHSFETRMFQTSLMKSTYLSLRVNKRR